MSKATLQDSVAAKIKALYEISQELEALFPGRHYTPDGHMIGSIGEALAASYYNLELFPPQKKRTMLKRRMAVWYRSKQRKSTASLFPVSRSGCLC